MASPNASVSLRTQREKIALIMFGILVVTRHPPPGGARQDFEQGQVLLMR